MKNSEVPTCNKESSRNACFSFDLCTVRDLAPIYANFLSGFRSGAKSYGFCGDLAILTTVWMLRKYSRLKLMFFFLIYIFFGDNEIFMILDLMVEEERVILDFEFHMRKERERERELL